MKITVLALAVLGLMIRGYFMYQANQIQSARQTLQSRQTVDQMRHNMTATADEAGGQPAAQSRPTATPNASAAAAANAERQEIEGALKAVHLTTIMPGQPGQVIIDKQDYSEGESLSLPKGRKAKIVAVQDDGVQLVCNGMTFHLDAPGAPDLAALRKKKP